MAEKDHPEDVQNDWPQPGPYTVARSIAIDLYRYGPRSYEVLENQYMAEAGRAFRAGWEFGISEGWIDLQVTGKAPRAWNVRARCGTEWAPEDEAAPKTRKDKAE